MCTILQTFHETKQLVRSVIGCTGSAATSSGMMGLIQHYQVPGGCLLQQFIGSVTSAQQVTGSDDKRFFMPFAARNRTDVLPGKAWRRVPCQFVVVINGPVQVKFFPQFDLPLFKKSCWRQDQKPSGFARHPCLPQQHTCLNSFAQPHFIGD
jgi:hypothetical protein